MCNNHNFCSNSKKSKEIISILYLFTTTKKPIDKQIAIKQNKIYIILQFFIVILNETIYTKQNAPIKQITIAKDFSNKINIYIKYKIAPLLTQ